MTNLYLLFQFGSWQYRARYEGQTPHIYLTQKSNVRFSNVLILQVLCVVSQINDFFSLSLIFFSCILTFDHTRSLWCSNFRNSIADFPFYTVKLTNVDIIYMHLVTQHHLHMEIS